MTVENQKTVEEIVINSRISMIDNKIKMLNEQRHQYEQKLKTLNEYDLFTKNEAKEIIEYLFSNVEKEKYTVKKIHFNTKSSSYNCKNMVSQYTFLYLVKEDKKEEAINKIEEKYNVYKIKDESYIKNISDMQKEDIDENYVKLSFYNKYSSNEVSFNESNKNNNIVIKINDERFSYINDFINKLLSFKITKEKYKLSISETKLFIDEYIEENKDSKKLINSIN